MLIEEKWPARPNFFSFGSCSPLLLLADADASTFYKWLEVSFLCKTDVAVCRKEIRLKLTGKSWCKKSQIVQGIFLKQKSKTKNMKKVAEAQRKALMQKMPKGAKNVF